MPYIFRKIEFVLESNANYVKWSWVKKIRKFVYQSQEKHTNLCQSVTQNYVASFLKLVSKCKFLQKMLIFFGQESPAHNILLDTYPVIKFNPCPVKILYKWITNFLFTVFFLAEPTFTANMTADGCFQDWLWPSLRLL